MVKRSLMISSVLLLLSGCSWLIPEPVVVTETKIVKPTIELKNPPRPVDMKPITWHVVTAENFEEFKADFTRQNGEFVFYAMSVNDYERIAINFADVLRYIEQQQQIIIYYESAISN